MRKKPKVYCIASFSSSYICRRNHYKTSFIAPTQEEAWVTSSHAEMRVLRMLPQEAKKVSLWVFRFRADGTLACAKPCPKCQFQILAVKGIPKKRVVYSDTDGFFRDMEGNLVEVPIRIQKIIHKVKDGMAKN